MNGTYALVDRDKRTTKGGKPFLVMSFQGLSTFKVWENYSSYTVAENAELGQWYEITGTFSTSSYGYEVKSDFDMVPGEKPPASGEVATAEEWVNAMITTVEDPFLKRIAEGFMEDNREALRDCAAARSVHHSQRGGLLVHTAKVMENASRLSKSYNCNRDLAVVGALVHDCGKLIENRYEPIREVMPFTVESELLSHIPAGLLYVKELSKRVAEDWVEDEAMEERAMAVTLHLLHLVCSHHGTNEWGSPVEPKTVEAMVLHCSDLIDARIEVMMNAYRSKVSIGSDLGSQIYDKRGANFVTSLSKYE